MFNWYKVFAICLDNYTSFLILSVIILISFKILCSSFLTVPFKTGFDSWDLQTRSFSPSLWVSSSKSIVLWYPTWHDCLKQGSYSISRDPVKISVGSDLVQDVCFVDICWKSFVGKYSRLSFISNTFENKDGGLQSAFFSFSIWKANSA